MREDREESLRFLREAGCSNKVIEHCQAVCDCALEYAARNPDVDIDLVRKGALLHDIGRGNTHSIHHAQEGADIVRSLGMPEKVARIVECHTGAGITADEATLLGLLPRDCVPTTTEEKIVTHADNRLAGVIRVSIYDTVGSAIHLPRRVRKRMDRIALEVHLLCSSPKSGN